MYIRFGNPKPRRAQKSLKKLEKSTAKPRHAYRYEEEQCPSCGVSSSEWCKSDCEALDLLDYR